MRVETETLNTRSKFGQKSSMYHHLTSRSPRHDVHHAKPPMVEPAVEPCLLRGDDHLRRMVNRDTLERICQFAKARTVEEYSALNPRVLTLDTTWNCNFKCHGCIDSTSRDGLPVVRQRQGRCPLAPDPENYNGPTLDLSVVFNAIDFCVRNAVRGIQLMGGETFCHPGIDQILERVADRGLPMEIVSNGSLLDEHIEPLVRAMAVEGSHLRISMNGWDSYGRRVGWPDRGVEIRDRIIGGLRKLFEVLPEERRDAVYVTTVAFRDTLSDLPDLVAALAQIGIRLIAVIRERDPRLKTFCPGRDDVADEVVEMVGKLRTEYPAVRFNIADNMLVAPAPQPKVYRPCPAMFFKAVLGADGYLYGCTDHRGCAYARLAYLGNYDWDLEKAWRSVERVESALNYDPANHCCDLVCQRYLANVVISQLSRPGDVWTC